MDVAMLDLTMENLAQEHLCCIIRSKKPHPGVEAKRAWLAQRLPEGHVLRKMDVKGCAFIEYAPVETAWTPVEGDGFLYIYCLWVNGEHKGRGYGKALMASCLADARAQGRSGVCMLGAQKQKAWLSDQGFAKRFGFQAVDATDTGYELLALSFDGTQPRFTPAAKRGTIDRQELTIYYDHQCPYVPHTVAAIRQHCEANQVPAAFIRVDTLAQAKAMPCPFNNWAVFYKGRFETVNLLDVAAVQRILRR